MKHWFTAALVSAAGCSDDGATMSATVTATGTTTATATTAPTTETTTTTAGTTGEPTTGGSQGATDSSATTPTTGTTGTPGTTGTIDTTGTTGTPGTTDSTGPVVGSSTTGPGCGVCDEPNQQCVDDICVTSCQGQAPDPCPQDQVCDIISGTCKPVDSPCTVAGPEAPCADMSCGPGTVCDGIGACLPIAPCADVACTGDGHCWGTLCGCERLIECQEPTADLLNGAFSTDIGGIDFADDCNAWMVTLRSGVDYLRRLTPAGELTTWAGVANLNMGEVKVLRKLTIPQLHQPLPLAEKPEPPTPVEGIGEVAITYTCCPSCGCMANPPQGVARLDEANANNPLPIVIVAAATQGDGPFGSTAADAGPHGLTWGEDRVLYVGNATEAANSSKYQGLITSAGARTASVTRLAA